MWRYSKQNHRAMPPGVDIGSIFVDRRNRARVRLLPLSARQQLVAERGKSEEDEQLLLRSCVIHTKSVQNMQIT